MGARRIRRDQRQADMKESRRVNGVRKKDEVRRRADRVLGMIKSQGQLPYSPVVMSWLSVQLGKPSRLITQDEVNQLVSAS